MVSTIEPNSPIEDDNVRNGSGDMNTSFEETGEMTNATGYDNANCYQNQQNYYTSVPEHRPLGDQETKMLTDQNFNEHQIDELLLSEVKSLLDELLAKIL